MQVMATSNGSKRNMARRRTRDSKGRFLKKGRKPRKRRATRNAPRRRKRSTRKGMRRRSSRRAYMKTAAPRRRRRARRNQAVSNKVLISVILWSSITALGQGYVRNYLGAMTGSPAAAGYGTVAAVGGLGYWLTGKPKTRAAGFAVLGVAFAQLANEIGRGFGLFPETAGGFVPRRQVMRRLPRRVNVGRVNPVARIVVPS